MLFYPRAGRRFTPCRLRRAPRTHTSGQFTTVCSVPFSPGQSRIPTVTAEWPGCRCLAEPPPLTCFDSTRGAIADVSTPTPWRTRPGRSRATPFEVARPDAPSPHVAQPEYTGRNGRRNLGRCDTMPSRSNPSQPPWRCADAVLPPCLTR